MCRSKEHHYLVTIQPKHYRKFMFKYSTWQEAAKHVSYYRKGRQKLGVTYRGKYETIRITRRCGSAIPLWRNE